MSEDLYVTRLSTTPVKGLQLHHPTSIHLTPGGARGDRAFYLVDHEGTVQSWTRNPGLAGLRGEYDEESARLTITRSGEIVVDGSTAGSERLTTDMWGLRHIESDLVRDPAWSTFFSDLLAKPVRLVRARTLAYDVAPLTILGEASVDELASRSGIGRVDPRRFRMLVQFSGGTAHLEDTWCGATLKVADAVLRAGGPVKRCAATTRHPDTGECDLQTLRLITAYRGRQRSVLGLGATFGIYAEVLHPGTVSVGDRVTVVS